MKNSSIKNKAHGTPIVLPDVKKLWLICVITGAVLWLIGLLLWRQGKIDEFILFYFNDARILYTPIVALSKWFSAYGMAFITFIYIVYLLASQWIKFLDAPLTVYLYTICSFGLSGIAGDLLKLVLARPRPVTTYGSQVFVISQAQSLAIPSGHATKSIALVLAFLLLVPNKKNLHKAIKIVIALIATGVCISRVVLGAHYFSDVLAGIGTALIGFPLTMLFANMILRKASQEKLPFLSKVWGALLVFLLIVFMLL